MVVSFDCNREITLVCSVAFVVSSFKKQATAARALGSFKIFVPARISSLTQTALQNSCAASNTSWCLLLTA